MKCKKIAAIVLAFVMILCFTACEGGGAAEGDPGVPKIVESGYSSEPLAGYVFVHWGVKIKNASETNAFEFYTLTVTAKDADGNVLETIDQTMDNIQPGEEQATGAIFGIKGGTEPETMEFTIKEGDKVAPNGVAIRSTDIEFVREHEDKDDYGGATWTGIVKNNSKSDAGSIDVTLLLYKDGKIVYGNADFVDDVKSGAEAPFEITDFDLPEYDSYELHGHGVVY